MNPPVPRALLIELCQRLDHDPDRVGRIIITPDKVDMIYTHRIVGDTNPRPEVADDE